jgi:hypothetical protein
LIASSSFVLFCEFRLLTGFGSSGLGSLDEDLAY